MKLKKQDNKKTSRVVFRCSEEEYNRIMGKALLYCQKENGEANISEWCLEATTKHVPCSEDLIEEKKPLRKTKRRGKK